MVTLDNYIVLLGHAKHKGWWQFSSTQSTANKSKNLNVRVISVHKHNISFFVCVELESSANKLART